VIRFAAAFAWFLPWIAFSSQMHGRILAAVSVA